MTSPFVSSSVPMTAPAALSSNSVAVRPKPATRPSHAHASPNAPAHAPERTTVPDSEFAPLMGLQQRGRDAVAKLRRQGADAPAGDPAATAIAQQHKHAATQLEQLLARAGSAPASNARHALARILGSVEQGGMVSGGDSLRLRLAQAADEGRVAPAQGAALRDVIAAIDKAGTSTSAAGQDPMMAQDPARLATLQARMKAITEAAKGVDTLLTSGQLSEPVVARLRTAAARENPGHMVRDVLSALRG